MALDILALTKKLENCPCGREHKIAISRVEISRGAKEKTGKILREELPGTRLHVVADDNTLGASGNILAVLEEAGWILSRTQYGNLKEATMTEVERIKREAADADAILSIGTGSLNDICRYAAFQTGKPFAIFATAPSMDGFLSQQAPIMTDGFKLTYNAKAPAVLIADTDILADSPRELKAAGLGDLIGKYTALADWKVARITTGEYYCEAIAEEMRSAVSKACELARQGEKPHDTEYAASLMEALALSGLMIYLSGCTRPASGAEHHLSHFWEMQYAAMGLPPVYHGKKVGIAAGIVSDIYHKAAEMPQPIYHPYARTDEDLKRVFGVLWEKTKAENTPDPMDIVNFKALEENWQEICRIVREEIPTGEEIRSILRAAGGETTPAEAGISRKLEEDAKRWGHLARFRITLLRILNSAVEHGEELYQ